MQQQSDIIRKSIFQVLQSEGLFYRVLFLNQISDHIYVIELRSDGTIGKYLKLSYSQFSKDVIEGKLVLQHNDQFSRWVDQDTITESAKAVQDHAWAKIECLVLNEPEIYEPKLRYRLIKEECSKEGAASMTSYNKWLKRYFAGGMVRNALLPTFYRCGAPEKEKLNSSLNAETKKIIRLGYTKFYRGNSNLRTAYKNTIQFYYNPDLHGTLFSIRQFYYWGSKGIDPAEKLKRKIGKRSFKSNRRLLSGRVTDIAVNVCELYQVDWTLMDVHVVRSTDNQYLGRPILYAVVDTVSRAIVGILLTFENPSYITFCNALYNAGRDKVEFASECGFELTAGEWPMCMMPIKILGDRGELIGAKADSLVNNLNITVQNTTAYSPEWKSVVEHLFKMPRLKQLFDGAGLVTKDYGERLAKDSRKEATVTLNELYRILIRCIVEYNNYHWIDDYPLTKEMARDCVKKIPTDIWKWASANGYMLGSRVDKETLWLNLLEDTMVTPNRKGIYLNKQHFVPVDKDDFLLLENLACLPHVPKVKISYDPRVYTKIYWIHEGRFIELRTRGKNDVKFSNVWEATSTNDLYREMAKEAKAMELQLEIESDKDSLKDIGRKRPTPLKLKGSKEARHSEKMKARKTLPSVSTSREKVSTPPKDRYKMRDYSKELEEIDNQQTR